jgi:hypothetical protein
MRPVLKQPASQPLFLCLTSTHVRFAFLTTVRPYLCIRHRKNTNADTLDDARYLTRCSCAPMSSRKRSLSTVCIAPCKINLNQLPSE